MRLSIKLSKLIPLLFVIFVPSFFLAVSPSASAFHPILANQFGVTSSSKSSGLSEEYLDDFSQNDITFWSPCEGGVSKSSSGFCGDTPREMYWSFFRQTLEPAQVAGILGNIESEGNYSPTNWEDEDNSSWAVRYSGALDGSRGVGSFQITGRLSEYLHFINDNHPDVLKYFQEPEYDVRGEELLEKVGKDVFIKIAEVEAEWITTHEQGHMEEIKKYNTPKDAAVYWAQGYEKCKQCFGMTENVMSRVHKAEAIYEELKDFVCSGSSKPSSSSSSATNANASSGASPSASSPSTSSTPNASSSTSNSSTSSASSGEEIVGGDVTWIGDSISVGAKAIIDQKLSGVDTGEGVNSDKSYIQDSKSVSQDSGNNPSCLNILEKNVDKARPYLVLACGTYGDWSDDNIKKVQDLVKGKSTKVVLVNSRTKDKDFADSNKRLKELANTNEQFVLADWSAAYDAKYFASDPNLPKDNGGYDKWVEVILTALKSAGEDNCTTFKGEYPEYHQWEGDWANQSYAGGTYSDSGCGPTSMAMLATVAAGKDILPTDVGAFGDYTAASDQGMVDLDQKVADKYGFSIEAVSYGDKKDTIEKVTKYLKDGYMIHLSGRGSPPFSGAGHYVGIYRLESDGHVFLADPGDRNSKDKYTVEDIVNAGMTNGVFTAIKGGGGSSCNANTCEEGGKNINTSGGVLEEQAQKIADYYNSDKVSAEGLPYGKENCVSFSCWFVHFFTDLAPNDVCPTRGDGLEVAGNLISDFHLNSSDKPLVWSVFSNPGANVQGSSNHTGVIVGIQGEEVITIEAAYGGWQQFGDGLAHVFRYKMPESGMIYADLNGHLDNSKVSQIIGGS